VHEIRVTVMRRFWEQHRRHELSSHAQEPAPIAT
jgi:hypothetical protein